MTDDGRPRSYRRREIHDQLVVHARLTGNTADGVEVCGVCVLCVCVVGMCVLLMCYVDVPLDTHDVPIPMLLLPAYTGCADVSTLAVL